MHGRSANEIESFVEKCLSDGVVIHSVDNELIDNGGKLDRGSWPIPGTDVGFQLWDPEHRRRPAGQPPKDPVEREIQ